MTEKAVVNKTVPAPVLLSHETRVHCRPSMRTLLLKAPRDSSVFFDQTNLDLLSICSVIKTIYTECRLWEAWKSLQMEKILSNEWRKGPAAVTRRRFVFEALRRFASAASAKQGYLISCCLQEAAVCCFFCRRYDSEPLVINLLRFNWSAPHCGAPAHTYTCWRK